MKSPEMRGRTGERGSALLIVFVLAAIVAIMLYKEMPIVVFEAQRQKEELLIDRGGEYAHAVKLYVRAIKQYPPNMEALENTNRMRFLRNRYVDPFTGKDNWRLLHAGPNGVIIDSKVKSLNAGLGKPGGNGPNQNNGIGSTGMGTFGGGDTNATLGNSVSSSANASFSGFNASADSSNSQLVNLEQGRGPGKTNRGNNSTGNATANGATGNSQPSGFGGFFSQPTSTNATGTDGNKSDNPISAAAQRAPAIAANGGKAPAGAAGAGGEAGQAEGDGSGSSQSPAYVPRSRRPNAAELASNATGQSPGEPNASDNENETQGNGFGSSQNSGLNPGGSGAGSVNTGLGNSGAVNRGASSFGGNKTGSAFGNTSRNGVIQNPGLAGVASKVAGQSIKVVNDQDNYALWEFYYDPTKDPMRGVMGPQGGGVNAGTGGQTGIGNTAAGSNTNSPFGNKIGNSGFGAGSGNSFGNNQNRGFGSNSSGFGNGGGFGNSGFSNGTTATSSQLPPPSSNPANRTMSTGSIVQ